MRRHNLCARARTTLAGKPAPAATGVADGDLSRQAARRKLRGAQITRQKKNGPANRQARS
jgi:hypothetical protein